MLRYHKKVYIPISAQEKIQAFTDNINAISWQYSKHSLDNLKYRCIDNKAVLLYIRDYQFNNNDVFEFYQENNVINKVCYRISYNDNIDLIIVMGAGKMLITIYTNLKNDEHFTLNKNLYNREEVV